MTFAELVAVALAHLERAGIPHMVTGSIASTYYGEARATRSALQARTQFNAIGPDASKIFFIIRRDRPFSVEEFGRRRPADLLGTPGWIATVEDMVLAKLEWAAVTDSERQLRDVGGMLAVGGDEVDLGYVVRWFEALGLREVWRRVGG